MVLQTSPPLPGWLWTLGLAPVSMPGLSVASCFFFKQDPALDFTTQPLPSAQPSGKPGLEGAHEQQTSPILHRSSSLWTQTKPHQLHVCRWAHWEPSHLEIEAWMALSCPSPPLHSPSRRSSPSRQRGHSLKGSGGFCLGGRVLPSEERKGKGLLCRGRYMLYVAGYFIGNELSW